MTDLEPAVDRELTAHPRTRPRLAIRLLVLTVVPVLLMCGFELGLRVTGFGYDTAPAVRRTIDGEPHWVNNPSFTWPYFGIRRAPESVPFALPVNKAEGSYRIMLVGDSVAQGEPDPSFGVARFVEVMLESRFPGADIEVVNGGITAANSWVLRDLVERAGDLDIDLWVVLAGNNEVVGPYGAASKSGDLARRPGLVRTRMWLHRLRIVQLVERVTGPFGSARYDDEWIGMEHLADRRIAAGDPRLEETYAAFSDRLQQIVEIVVGRGESLLLCTVPVNLADCAPFASGLSAQHADEERATWHELFDAGVALQAEGRFEEAMESFRSAARIDDTHAELLYRMARCLRQSGQAATAVGYLHRARDLDELRFRADARINAAIRDVAEAHASEGIALVDLGDAFAAASPGGAPGDGLFYEHVHFNFTGAWLAARQLVAAILPRLPEQVLVHDLASRPMRQEEGVERLVFSEWDRYRIARDLHSRIQQPPFNLQMDNADDVAAVGAWSAGLQQMVANGGLERSLNAYVWALRDHGDDWFLHYNLGQLELDGFGNGAGAEPHFRRVVEAHPSFVYALGNLGAAMMLQDKPAEAAALFERARMLRPRSVAVLANLALARVMQQQWDEAVELFDDVLELEPDQRLAMVQLAQLLVDHGGDAARAEALLNRAIELDPDDQEARAALDKLRGEK